MPSDSFHLFIVAKTGTHVEDLLFIAYPLVVNKARAVFGVASGGSSGGNSSVSKSGVVINDVPLQVCCPTSGVCSIVNDTTHEKEKSDEDDSQNTSKTNTAQNNTASTSTKKATTTGGGHSRDVMMDVHHIITAMLCISSFVSGE
jgi:hypothetical protein